MLMETLKYWLDSCVFHVRSPVCSVNFMHGGQSGGIEVA